MKQHMLVIAGAICGGIAGYYVAWWIYTQGFYGLVIPGGFLGLGAGMAKNRSKLLAVVCGIAALALGLYTEWSFFPRDMSATEFLQSLHGREPIRLIMIALGGIIGFWCPYQRIPRRATQAL
jgi:hypothetical protein